MLSLQLLLISVLSILSLQQLVALLIAVTSNCVAAAVMTAVGDAVLIVGDAVSPCVLFIG